MTMMSGSLNDLLDKQTKLMIALGIFPDSGTIISTGVPSKSELGAAIGITVESAEILELIEKANRKWKPDGDTASLVKEELIDVVFFTLELAVLLGLSADDLSRLYTMKYRKNLSRLFHSYGSVARAEEENPYLMSLLDEEQK
jgi:NTP pyrophosphatase (non-canonical NTP hydrolase)